MSHSISLVANEVQDYYSKVIMSPSVYLGIFFLEQFDFAVSHWSRIRELEADKAGHRSAHRRLWRHHCCVSLRSVR